MDDETHAGDQHHHDRGEAIHQHNRNERCRRPRQSKGSGVATELIKREEGPASGKGQCPNADHGTSLVLAFSE